MYAGGIDFASFYDFSLNAPTLVKINNFFNCVTPLYCIFSEKAVNTNFIALLIENKSWSKHEGNLDLESQRPGHHWAQTQNEDQQNNTELNTSLLLLNVDLSKNEVAMFVVGF